MMIQNMRSLQEIVKKKVELKQKKTSNALEHLEKSRGEE